LGVNTRQKCKTQKAKTPPKKKKKKKPLWSRLAESTPDLALSHFTAAAQRLRDKLVEVHTEGLLLTARGLIKSLAIRTRKKRRKKRRERKREKKGKDGNESIATELQKGAETEVEGANRS